MMFRDACLIAVGILIAFSTGCGVLSRGELKSTTHSLPVTQPNPLTVPLIPRELVMDEVSDEIDNYFRILREQRIRLNDNLLTEGWIDTKPKMGSSVLEPWRKDSTPGFELAHASLQTVRRWARVRVIPGDNHYRIDVKVYKELEDLLEPENSTTSGRIGRHDNSLDYDQDEPLLRSPNKGWIPMGRDFSLEQTILANIKQRIVQLTRSGQSKP